MSIYKDDNNNNQVETKIDAGVAPPDPSLPSSPVTVDVEAIERVKEGTIEYLYNYCSERIKERMNPQKSYQQNQNE